MLANIMAEMLEKFFLKIYTFLHLIFQTGNNQIENILLPGVLSDHIVLQLLPELRGQQMLSWPPSASFQHLECSEFSVNKNKQIISQIKR